MKTDGIPSPVEKGNPNEPKPGLKEKAIHQLREFLGMFIYLWVLFALFSLHQSIVLAQEHINYQAQGFAIINALVLAKVMLIGEDLHLGDGLRDKPLLYSILYKTFLFSVFLISFHILEEVLVGVIRSKTIAQSFPAIGWRKPARNIVRASNRVCRSYPVFCIQGNRKSDRATRTAIPPLESWNQGLHTSIKAATVIPAQNSSWRDDLTHRPPLLA
jgi:hypothetical protein